MVHLVLFPMDTPLLFLSLFLLGVCLPPASGECPQDPLACIQSIMSSVQKKSQEDSLGLEDFENPDNGREVRVKSNETELGAEVNATLVKCADEQTLAGDTTGPCKRCTQCPKNAHILRKCNLTHDTLCVCEKGAFLSVVNNECKPCSPCPHGWGVWRQCNRNRNTVCRKCPPGTYSGVLSGTLGCVLCTSCRSDQVMLQECSRIQDTFCVDRSISQRNHFPTNSDSERSDISQLNDGSALPIYFTVLVVIVCGLVGYVLLQWRLKHVMKTPPGAVGAQTTAYMPASAGSRGCVNYSPLPQTHLYRQTAAVAYPHQQHSRQLQQHTRNSCNALSTQAYRFPVINSFIPASVQKPSRGSSLHVVRYCDLNSTKKRALEASLNPIRSDCKDWKGLAKELGYANTSISAFECLGKERYGPTRHLLSDWSRSEKATVNVLVVSLLRVGRVDSAFIIDPTCLRTHPVLPPGNYI